MHAHIHCHTHWHPHPHTLAHPHSHRHRHRHLKPATHSPIADASDGTLPEVHDVLCQSSRLVGEDELNLQPQHSQTGSPARDWDRNLWSKTLMLTQTWDSDSMKWSEKYPQIQTHHKKPRILQAFSHYKKTVGFHTTVWRIPCLLLCSISSREE